MHWTWLKVNTLFLGTLWIRWRSGWERRRKPNLLSSESGLRKHGWTEPMMGNGPKCYCMYVLIKAQGGNKKYEKKNPKQGRKVPTKWCGCACCLTIKCYPNTKHILGLYEDTHSHPIGHDNAGFTCLPEDTCLRMAEMLHMGITHKQMVSLHCLIILTKYILISCLAIWNTKGPL